jgi:hypothetical protein
VVKLKDLTTDAGLPRPNSVRKFNITNHGKCTENSWKVHGKYIENT